MSHGVRFSNLDRPQEVNFDRLVDDHVSTVKDASNHFSMMIGKEVQGRVADSLTKIGDLLPKQTNYFQNPLHSVEAQKNERMVKEHN